MLGCKPLSPNRSVESVAKPLHFSCHRLQKWPSSIRHQPPTKKKRPPKNKKEHPRKLHPLKTDTALVPALTCQAGPRCSQRGVFRACYFQPHAEACTGTAVTSEKSGATNYLISPPTRFSSFCDYDHCCASPCAGIRCIAQSPTTEFDRTQPEMRWCRQARYLTKTKFVTNFADGSMLIEFLLKHVSQPLGSRRPVLSGWTFHRPCDPCVFATGKLLPEMVPGTSGTVHLFFHYQQGLKPQNLNTIILKFAKVQLRTLQSLTIATMEAA